MQTSLLTLALIVSSFALGPVLSAQVPQIINYQGRIAVSDVNFEGEGQFKFALVNGGEDLAAQALASAQLVNGFVIGATITDAGLGYLATPTVTINGAGTGATATATVDAGVVTGITILTAGSGYTEGGTTIVIDGPSENLIYSSYWSNDGSSAVGDEPTDSVTLSVVKGLYSVLLGDDTITNMTPIPASVFANPDVRLRVWFDDGTANGSQLLTPDQRIASVGYAMMAGDVPNGSITSNKLAAGAVTADKIAAGSLTEGLAAEGSVIVASGQRSDLVDAGFFQVGTLAETNLWGETASTNAPAARGDHTAVWTGTEMIILGWAGVGTSNAGARYNPSTDTWTATSLINAPAVREDHTAVWTGTEMIIWGGEGDPATLNTGARYDPSTDTWSSTSLINAPAARSDHTAVWTGTEMIIWGGLDSTFSGLNNGARYDPETDTWTATSLINAPAVREDHTAVWTGTEMIIWGGDYGSSGNNPDSGARYDPEADTWTATSLINAPVARESHTAVWTDTEMIIWGGSVNPGSLNSGARYNPSTDTWSSTSLTNAPVARASHTAVWSDSEMIIWGGSDGDEVLNSGARYNPSTDTWSTTSLTNAPAGRSDHTAVWTDTEMIIWGGFDSLYSGLNTGGIYRPGEALYFYLKP